MPDARKLRFEPTALGMIRPLACVGAISSTALNDLALPRAAHAHLGRRGADLRVLVLVLVRHDALLE